jgi:hypothetical protein
MSARNTIIKEMICTIDLFALTSLFRMLFVKYIFLLPDKMSYLNVEVTGTLPSPSASGPWLACSF